MFIHKRGIMIKLNNINFIKTKTQQNFGKNKTSAQNVQVQFPTATRNFCKFNELKTSYIASQKSNAIPYIKYRLANSTNEADTLETLYIIDKMLENGTKRTKALYPLLSKFNNTTSPNIQVFLAGIYRKMQVPDAFGPLVGMLIRNSISQKQNQYFDPNEEIGGAILSYLSERFRS